MPPARSPRPTVVAALAGLIGLAAAGCSSSTAGTGSAPTAAPTTAAPSTLGPAPTTAAATTAAPSTVPPATAPPTCPEWGPAVVTGRAGAGLEETSGLVAGRRNPSLLWAHNDSGDAARVFALDQTGRVVTEVTLPGALALDWEDLAAAPGPDGTPWLWVADTGDNLSFRPFVTLYGFPEPDLAARPPFAEASDVQAVRVRYPDGPADTEALLVDPVTGDAFLVAKAPAPDGTVAVHRVAAAQLRGGDEVTAEVVARVVGRTGRGNGPTSGDISADGTLVVVANGREGFAWLRDPATPVGDVLGAAPLAPCRVPVGGGEALGLSVDGRHLWSMSEGAGADLRRFDRR